MTYSSTSSLHKEELKAALWKRLECLWVWFHCIWCCAIGSVPESIFPVNIFYNSIKCIRIYTIYNLSNSIKCWTEFCSLSVSKFRVIYYILNILGQTLNLLLSGNMTHRYHRGKTKEYPAVFVKTNMHCTVLVSLVWWGFFISMRK